MRKLSMVLASLLCSSSALAQDLPAASATSAVALSATAVAARQSRNDDAESLIGRRRLIHHHGWYAAPSLGVTIIDGDAAAMMGVRTGWLINHRFGLGFAASAFSNDITDDGSSRGKVEGGYGGVALQYVLAAGRRVHGYVETTIGGGGVCVYKGFIDDGECGEYAFFAFENTTNLEVNLTSFARASVGAGFRLVASEDDNPLSNRELGGFVARTAVSFGRF